MYQIQYATSHGNCVTIYTALFVDGLIEAVQRAKRINHSIGRIRVVRPVNAWSQKIVYEIVATPNSSQTVRVMPVDRVKQAAPKLLAACEAMLKAYRLIPVPDGREFQELFRARQMLQDAVKLAKGGE